MWSSFLLFGMIAIGASMMAMIVAIGVPMWSTDSEIRATVGLFSRCIVLNGETFCHAFYFPYQIHNKKYHSQCHLYHVSLHKNSTKYSNDFYEKTCSPLGHATLSFSLISPSFGFVSLLLSILGYWKGKTQIFPFSFYLGVLATICTAITLVLWNAQSWNLRTTYHNSKAGASICLNFVAIILYSVASFCIYEHSQLEKEQRDTCIELKKSLLQQDGIQAL